jgi:ferrous iron transport protein B
MLRMREVKIHIHPTGPLVALVGNPNCGKTALFNLLTGSHQKVANYAGVTVERKEGKVNLANGQFIRLLDLPGTYSLYPRSQDERVTCNVLAGRAVGEKRPDLVVCVVDATNLRRNLRLVLAVKRLGIPAVVVLNMSDVAEQRGLTIDSVALAAEIGLPVVKSVGVKTGGGEALLAWLSQGSWRDQAPHVESLPALGLADEHLQTGADHQVVQGILKRLHLDQLVPDVFSDRLDRVLLHPVVGPMILTVVLFLVFQALFSWATVPMEIIKGITEWSANQALAALPDAWWRSLLIDGVIAGLGGVVVFLPQILILFFFILMLEETGYLPRAAFLLDRIMGSVGLSGRSFIPLLSSFACAIPGIMAARTIPNARDRMVTILIAPLMTCSARLPVYTLLISAFIPKIQVWGGLALQGLVMFALYVAGIVGAMAVAWVLKVMTRSGRLVRPLMMELPTYHLPTVRNIAIGLWQRVKIFMRRVGGIILVLTIALWFLASFPAPPEGATRQAIEYSMAGWLGHWLAVVFEPIGFNWQISLALVPGMAAREVVVSALGTVYALSSTGEHTAEMITPIIAQQWSMATALSLLTWFVFAPQCLSTLAAIQRETGGWRMPVIAASYLFALAYGCSFVVYRCAVWAGLG